MDNIDKDNYNTQTYKEKIDKSSSDELSSFADFHHKIQDIIKSNQQITINNLNHINESLSNVRQETNKLTHSIINHDEEMIIKKEKVMKEALDKIHKNNLKVLNFESDSIKDGVYSIDHLYHQLIKENLGYYDVYKFYFDSTIDIINDDTTYLKNKNKSMNYVIEKHFKEITEEFNNLDNRISDIDEFIKKLISTKSHKEDILDEFFDIEITNLIDSQINFSIEEDPYSNEIQSITDEKIRQYKQYSNFLSHQEKRLTNQLNEEIESKFNELYHKKYNQTNKQNKAEKYAHKKIKPIVKDQENILYQFKKDNLNTLLVLDKSLKLYLNIYKTDPFLAQVFSETGGGVIHKEIEFTRLYKTNKALKYHIYYTYKLAQLNQQIKLYEYQLVHFVENKFSSQETDVINIIKDVQSYLIERQSQIETGKIVLKRDKEFILFLNALIEEHIIHQTKTKNLNRKFLSEFSKAINNNIYTKADVDTKIITASSDIRLALKESEVETLHFKNLFDHEKRMLLVQQKRIDSETQVNFELISETHLNQMRFAKEQIRLAEEDFKMRLTSIIYNIDNERIHFYDLISNEVQLKEDAANHNFAKYQKEVYDIINSIESSDNQSKIKKLQKELTQVKDAYRREVFSIISKYKNNQRIQLYQKRLAELDMYLEDSYLAASQIYDETVREMDEIYRYTQNKYQDFIDGIDKSAHPLDDFLYESLQMSKKRLFEKSKYAEITLETKIGNLIEDYKKLYFNSDYQVNSKQVVELLNQYEIDKDSLHHEYNNNISLINENYYLKIDSYNNQIRHIQLDYESKKNDVISEKNKIIKNKINDINHNDSVFNDFIKKTKKKNKETLNKLIENYLTNIDINKQFYDELQDDYIQLLDSFKEYIKYSKKTPNVHKVIKQTLKNHKKDKRNHFKSLRKEKKNVKLF